MSLLSRLKIFLWRSIYPFYWLWFNFNKINSRSRFISTHYQGAITYDTDGLTTSNNCDFITEPRFAKAYAYAAATNPWKGFTLQWRVYVVCWFANHVKGLAGDFVECGVNTGAYSRAVIDYIEFEKLGKTFYLLDTFDGFPDDQVTEPERVAGIMQYGGSHYKDVYDQVLKTFAGFPVDVIRGRVPDTLLLCKTQAVAYLSIDMNAVVPEIAAMEFFWDKLVPGAVIILDDYGFPMHINQKKAFDAFAKSRKTEILSLPTGQGIMFKS
ncbi:MAG TPA: MtfD protein [Cytophagales bacterium]|nr:MtfD protein [Cytophagales bacterium]